MGKTAFMFPGQGSQVVGMALDFYNNFSESKKIIESANTALGFNLKELMFNGAIEELTKTENAQPALLTASIAMLKALETQKGVKPSGVIGHSLGEYTAYVASGRLEFTDGVKLVRNRGLFMANADPEGLGGMAAVLKLSNIEVEELLTEHKDLNVSAANYNCPGQLVISGSKDGIEKLVPLIAQKGGRAMVLPVSGAFHSFFMKKAAQKLKDSLNSLNFKESDINLYSNYNALPLIKGNEIDTLEKQLYSPVLFMQSVQKMIEDGFDTFIEIGSGKVLQGLVKKIDPSVIIKGIEKIEDLNNF